ncbi:unnamed protein product [Nippostrongylus brasiliensis]|uniref:Leucine Rich repeat-containing domain protein n=1 Tax=Nippostrongylus brasiliensis TaxID=27835 RepID=A0A0N4YJP5_NIPBR|nr:unnamed protein product [Nippostrongylus brasiliensis]
MPGAERTVPLCSVNLRAAFNGPLLDSLVELDLNDNNLGQIPQTGLTRLRNLRKLYLNRNRINTLASNAFAGYESKDLIIKLSLAGNRLTDQSLTDTAVFRPLRLLQVCHRLICTQLYSIILSVCLKSSVVGEVDGEK